MPSRPPRPPRPFRFSVQCSSPAAVDRRSWTDLARRCEDLGYSALTVSDHFDEQVAPAPALMAAADATTTLRVGAMVFSNDYHHPVVLAKEAATLDVLSDGRLDLGLGAGWMTADYQRAGLRLDPFPVRLARLRETVRIVKALCGPDPVTFHGEHYRIDVLQGTPTPVQRPHPPIFIGGGGRRMLTLAAQEADIVGLNPSMRAGVIDASIGADATAEATDRKLDWIAEAAGERWPSLELQVRIHLALVTPDRAGLAEALASGFGLTPAEAVASPHQLCGTVDQIVEDLVARRERFGISAIGLPVDALDAFAPVVARLAGA